MRVLFVLLLLSVGYQAPARTMFVVVYTSDGLVVNYRCSNLDPGVNNEAVATRRVVRSQGRVSWHVVGGVPPYTVLRNGIGAGGSVCVTVIDAAGSVATGCGVVQVLTQEVSVNCALGDAPAALITEFRPETKDEPETKVDVPPTPRKPLTDRRSEVGERPINRREPTGAAGGSGMQREFPSRREVTPAGGSTGGGGVRTTPSAPQRKF